tara:strand:- start:1100 stop:1501 length:402 start_codon:yes stop_codon:yes gene_type:complete
MKETNKEKGVEMTNAEKVKVGDIFVQATGYTVSRNRFYQVFNVSPSGKTVKVARIESEVVTNEGNFSGTEVPVEMAWIPENKWLQARVVEIEQPVWDENDNVEIVNQPALKFPYEDSKGKVWDGKAKSFCHTD